MLTLNFTGPFGTAITVGPAAFFRVEGAMILSGPEHELIARLTANNQWEVCGRFFTRYDANSALQVCLMDGTDEQLEGPFDMLFGVGNVKYADEQPLARFNHSARCWQDSISQRCWPALLLSPVERAEH